MILTLVQWGPESTLKAGLASECPPPRVTGLRTVGRVGAPGSAPPWIFRLRVPSSQTSEVPSPGSRAHAGRPLKQREGKWGSLSPQPNTHMGRQRAPPPPPRESRRCSAERAGPTPCGAELSAAEAWSRSTSRFPELPTTEKRPAACRAVLSVAREDDSIEEMGYLLLVFFFFFLFLKLYPHSPQKTGERVVRWHIKCHPTRETPDRGR